MQSLLRYSLFLLITLSLVSAACSGYAESKIPALISESKGNLINISVHLIPGKGDVYLTVNPNTGGSTQNSVRGAVEHAFIRAGVSQENCDVLIRIDNSVAQSVDGPSGGIAFSVITYAALNDLPVRADAAITGAVDKNGNIFPVGGLYEKAKAALSNNLSYFVTPTLSFHDHILLHPFLSTIHIVQIENMDEAISFLVYGKEVLQKNLTFGKRDLPNISSYDAGIPEFKAVAESIISVEKNSIDSIPDDGEFSTIKEYLDNELIYQTYLVQKGYLFTAANEAFLTYIDASTLVDFNKIGLDKKKVMVNLCLDSIQIRSKNMNNFQYIVGSDLRKSWARNKLDIISTGDLESLDDKYFTYNQLMYADAWCHVSKSLALVGMEMDGTAVDESALKPMAEQYLSQAKALNSTNADWRDHISSAQMLFDGGLYGGAILDSTYVIAMNDAEMHLVSGDNKQISELVSIMKKEKRTSLWGKVYQSQAVFVSNHDNQSAYTLFLYSRYLDNRTQQMLSIFDMQKGSMANGQQDSKPRSEFCTPSLVLMLTIFIGGIFYASNNKLY
ncbi:MAG: S16 family serine protease [Candidatus Micrarchaeota archaeon]